MTMHDVHVLDLATLTWKEVSEFPPSQPSASAAGPSAASEEAHTQLPPGGVQGWRACPHAQPGCPTRGAPPAALLSPVGRRSIHLLLLLRVAPQVTQQIVGKQGLLQRVAHSAVVHPTEPQTILIYGGFTDFLSSRFLDTLVALDTASMRVKELKPHGIPPSPRAYHQMVMCANR